jgi:hypothetical protein
MRSEERAPGGSATEKPSRRGPRRAAVVVVGVLAIVIALLVISRPDGASYEEYLQLREGMRRPQVVGIIGEGDYWHHYEGDRDVTNWVNRDGTYIRAVFDKNDVLVEVSWESGWDPARQKD